MAPRWGGLRPEPYDPDARDADGDGIVQEGTAWERPGGTRLIDRAGRAIQRGANSTTRPAGLRVVDRDGKPVDYKPTYGDGPSAIDGGTGAPTALSDFGARPLRDIVPDVRTITRPEPPEPPPDTRTPAEKARNRTADVERRLADAGAKFGTSSPEMLIRMEGLDRRMVSDRKEEARRLRRTLKLEIERLREKWAAGEVFEERIEVNSAWSNFIASMPPEMKQYLTETNIDEILDDLIEEAHKYKENVSHVQVHVKAEALIGILTSGKVKTTFEGDTARSASSSREYRRAYESTIGLPKDLPPDLRPVSAVAIHRDVEAERMRRFTEREGRPPTEFDDTTKFDDVGGASSGYGRIVVRLRPEATARTAIAWHDTLNTVAAVSRMDNFDPEDSFVALFHGVKPATGSYQEHIRALRMLHGRLKGNQSAFTLQMDDWEPDEHDDYNAYRDYIEALIPAGATADDIEVIQVPFSILDHKHGDGLHEHLVRTDPEYAEEIRKKYFTLEGLMEIGVPEDIAKEFMEEMHRYSLSDPPYQIKSLLRYDLGRRLIDEAEKQGIRLIITNVEHEDERDHSSGAQGKDRFDPATFGVSTQEEIRQGHLRLSVERITETVETRRRLKEKPVDESAGGMIYV